MKNTSLVLSIAALVIAVVIGILSFTGKCSSSKTGASEEGSQVAAGAGAVVYFQLDKVLQEYDMANDLGSVVETKVQNIQAAVTSRQKKLEKEYSTFNEKINKGLMTSTTAQVQAQKLESEKAEFEQFANQKQQEIYEEQQVMMNTISDAIKSYLETYNAEKKYALVFANQGGSPVVTGDAALDVTDEIIAGLNEEYVKNKNNKKEAE